MDFVHIGQINMLKASEFFSLAFDMSRVDGYESNTFIFAIFPLSKLKLL